MKFILNVKSALFEMTYYKLEKAITIAK